MGVSLLEMSYNFREETMVKLRRNQFAFQKYK